MFLNLNLFGFQIKSIFVNLLIFVLAVRLIPVKKLLHLDWAVYCALFFMTLMVVPIIFLYKSVNPIAYVYGLNISFFPVFLFFVGRSLTISEIKSFIDFFVGLHVLIYILFITFFFLRPDFYVSYLQNNIIQSDETWILFSRMQGFYGSTVVGSMAVILLYFVFLSSYKVPIKIFFYALFIFSIILSLQRSSMVMAGVFLLYLFCRQKAYKSIFSILLSSSLTAFVLSAVEPSLYEVYINRFLEISSALTLEDRISYSYLPYFISNYPFGIGLGSATSSATADGVSFFEQVVDANHVKIIVEMGVVGFFVYMMPAIVSSLRIFRGISTVELCLLLVVFTIHLQCLGTNLLDSYYLSHIYWLIIGFLGALSLRRRRLESEKKITSCM